jgi:hypothetical protein
MKKIALAAAMSLAAGSAFAGNIEPAPVEPAPVEPVVIVEDTSTSVGGVIVPVLALILIAAAVALDN